MKKTLINLFILSVSLNSNANNTNQSLNTKIEIKKVIEIGDKKISQNKKFKIGDKAFGGVIIEIDKSGLHGLVMALKDQDNFAISQEDDSPNKEYNRAFKVCKDLKLNGFNDWRLPQDNEITLIYTNGKKFLSKNPGYYLDKFSTTFFMNENGHLCYNVIDKETVNYYRNDYYKVRAVREF